MATTLTTAGTSAGPHREETIPEEGKVSPVVAPEPEEEVVDTAYSKSELFYFPPPPPLRILFPRTVESHEDKIVWGHQNCFLLNMNIFR